MLVGYTASGLNDAKPTPVDPVMPGVEVMAEATEALIAGSAIRVAAGLAQIRHRRRCWSALTAFAFFRGEPATDIDSIFVATNLALLSAAFVGLTFFGYFFDIFASVGFVSLVFGLCRMYAGPSAAARSAMATTCRISIRRGTAGSRSRGCASCRTGSSTPKAGARRRASTIAGCGASCTRAAMP